jgi:hypothetical protein
MRKFRTILAGSAALAAMAAAAPAAAQYPYGYSGYAQPYGYAQSYGYAQPYGYAQQYGNSGYGYGMNTNAAAQQCTAAVQNRLYSRNSGGVGTILGSLFGVNMAPTSSARVVSVTSATRTSSGLRVRGLASSGRYAYNPYGAYGSGAYGALGYGYASQADLSFKCDVDYRGYVRDIDINRR